MKTLLDNGEIAVGVQLRFGSPAIAELYARAGLDFIILDCEHAPQTSVGVQAQIQGIGCTDATPVVRVSQNDPDLFRVYLDMGAPAVFAPFINTAEQARLGAEALRYPPSGTRGYGPARASEYGFDAGYFKEANDNMLYLANIEHEDAVRNIDEILAVEGLDSFSIGPCDLSISMGIPMDLENPRFKDAVKTILRAAEQAGKPAGTGLYGGDFGDPDSYRRVIDMGFSWILIDGDEWMLKACCQRAMDAVSKVRV